MVQFATAWLLHDRPDGDDQVFENTDENSGEDADEKRHETVSPGISLFYLYLHRRLLTEGEDFHSAPGREDEYEDDEDLRYRRNAAFRDIHDRIFGRRQV